MTYQGLSCVASDHVLVITIPATIIMHAVGAQPGELHVIVTTIDKPAAQIKIVTDPADQAQTQTIYTHEITNMKAINHTELLFETLHTHVEGASLVVQLPHPRCQTFVPLSTCKDLASLLVDF